MKKILDIGCGLGVNITKLEKKGEVTGIDISSNFIDHSRKAFPKSKFLIMSAENLKFSDGTFDEIHCYDVLEHIDDLQKAFKEIKRVLKTKGKFFFDIPYLYSEVFFEKLNPNYLKEVHHQRKFTYEMINQLLNKFNFKIISAKFTKSFDNLYWAYNFLSGKNISSQQGEIINKDNITNILNEFVGYIYSKKTYYKPEDFPNYQYTKEQTQNYLQTNPEDLYFFLKMFDDFGNLYFPKTISISCCNSKNPNNDLKKFLSDSQSKSSTHSIISNSIDKSFDVYGSESIKNLKSELNKQNEKAEEYFAMLNKIYHSKTWKFLGIYKKTTGFLKNLLKKIIPITVRKKFKSIIESKISFEQINNVIPSFILKEWNSWNYIQRQEKSLDVINFSIIAWDFRLQRPQHLAKILGETNNRVFYIKNEFLPYNNPNSIFAPIKVEKKSQNVYEVTLSASRNLFIYSEIPSPKDIKIITASLKNLINQAQIANPIAKMDHPFWSGLLKKISMPTIYDCMDNHQGFDENGKHLASLEKDLFQESDLTLVTSRYLQKIAGDNGAKNMTLVQNAGDYDFFKEAAKKTIEIPSDIEDIPHPIIGYYGALAEWFDTDILESIAKKHQNKSIVLIGNVTNNLITKIANKYKNIHLLGEKPYHQLPKYLSQFDVCIIPFILSELIKATHPVKIFEYLAAGKPVVATKMPEILDMKEVFFAEKKDFNDQITIALKNKSKSIKERQNIAKSNTWITRSKIFTQSIYEQFFPRVSLILLSYNSPEMVKNTIDSILTRSFYPNLELIVVDNNSDKETKGILKIYQNNPKIKLIFNDKNYGFAEGNNIGLKKANGEYLILINNDVLVTPGWISRLIFHVRKDKVGLVGPVTNNIGNEAKIDISYNPFEIKDLEKQALNYTSSHWGETLDLKNIAAFCWMMPKKIYKKIGELDKRFGRGMFEDDDYCMRVKKEGYKIVCADDVFIHHYGGASFKKIETSEYQKIFDENKKKFEKKWKVRWVAHNYRK